MRRFIVECEDPHEYWGADLKRGIENAVYGMTCIHDVTATEVTDAEG